MSTWILELQKYARLANEMDPHRKAARAPLCNFEEADVSQLQVIVGGEFRPASANDLLTSLDA